VYESAALDIIKELETEVHALENERDFGYSAWLSCEQELIAHRGEKSEGWEWVIIWTLVATVGAFAFELWGGK
jgi:hypothetical protein